MGGAVTKSSRSRTPRQPVVAYGSLVTVRVQFTLSEEGENATNAAKVRLNSRILRDLRSMKGKEVYFRPTLLPEQITVVQVRQFVYDITFIFDLEDTEKKFLARRQQRNTLENISYMVEDYLERGRTAGGIIGAGKELPWKMTRMLNHVKSLD
jgi:hypothetical protein